MKTTQTNERQQQLQEPTAMSVWKQLLHFIIPAVVMILSVYVFIPIARNVGFSDYESFVLSHTIPMALLFVFSLAIYKYKNPARNMDGFRVRYRIPKLSFKDILFALLLFGLIMIGYGVFSQLASFLLSSNLIPLPDNLPVLIDPRVPFSVEVFEQFIDAPIKGNGMVLWSYTIMLIFNVVGEELYWRGYLLPIQEQTFGSKTWIVHGLLWTLFHAFKWWDLIGLLPVCLLISYFAQKRQNIWPGLIAHFLFNGLALFMIATAIFS